MQIVNKEALIKSVKLSSIFAFRGGALFVVYICLLAISEILINNNLLLLTLYRLGCFVWFTGAIIYTYFKVMEKNNKKDIYQKPLGEK